MRWNCPHCDALVSAGIDFETTKKAYVRCTKCNGTALLHRSAALADAIRAHRSEKEAKLEAELRLAEIQNLNDRLTRERTAPVLVSSGMGTTIASMPTPPPFRFPLDEVVAAPPTFAYSNPPAFLLKPNPIEILDEFSEEIDFEVPPPKEKVKSIEHSMIALWIAAAVAIASGAYLFQEGKKALRPTASVIVQKD